MSHFTSIKTRIVEKEYLKQALDDLGYAYREDDAEIRGFGGRLTRVEIAVQIGRSNFEIGLRRDGETYEVVADWWGARAVKKEEFVRRLTRRYAYHAACAKLVEQGFSIAEEEEQEDERIHIVLRRTV